MNDDTLQIDYVHLYDDPKPLKAPKVHINIDVLGNKIDENSTTGRVIQAIEDTTFGKLVQKVKAYSEAPEIDESYNPKEIVDEYKKAGISLNKQQLQAIYTAGNKEQAHKALELIDLNNELDNRLQNESLGYKALSTTADILGDPLNLLPMGFLSKGSKLTKIAKGAGVGGAFGAVYAKANEETSYIPQDYANYIAIGSALGGGLSALGALLDKDVDKIFDKQIVDDVSQSVDNFINKGKNTSSIVGKATKVINTMFDDVFTKLHKSDNPFIRDIGKALAPDTAGKEGNNLFSGIGIKRILNKQYQQTMKEYDTLIKDRAKQYGMKKEEYEEYVSHYYYLQSIKEDLVKQVKELETPELKAQIDDLDSMIKSLEDNFSTINKDTDLVKQYFRNFKYHYEQVGGKLSDKKWYAPTKWDFKRIANIPTERLIDDFSKAVETSNLYEKYIAQAEKKQEMFVLDKEDFVKEVAQKIVDSLKNKQYNGIIELPSNLVKTPKGSTATATYRIKIRGINKYPVMHYMKNSFFDTLGEYGFKMSSNIALRYSLENLKSLFSKYNVEVTDDLIDDIVDTNIHSPNEVYKKFIQIARQGGDITPKEEDLLTSAVRTITGYNNTVANPDNFLYKAGQFIDRMSTFMFGSHFGYVSALTDLPSSQIGGTLLKTSVGKSILELPKELFFLEKQWKNRQVKNSMGEFMYRLGVFADRLVNTRWISLETKLIENKSNSLFQKFIDMMDTANVKILEATGTNWVGGMSEAIVYHTFMEDFMKIATNPKLADKNVLNTLGLTEKEAIELGKLFKKSFGNKDKYGIAHISFDKLYKNVKDSVIKRTILPKLEKDWKAQYVKNKFNRLKKTVDRKQWKDLKQQIEVDSIELWNKKKDTILSKYLQSEDGKNFLDFAIFNDRNSPIFKFNVAIQNAIDLFSITGNVTRASHIINDAQRANEYFINTLLGKFVKLPASVHSTMVRNRVLNNKTLLASMIIQGASVYGIIEYLIDNGLYNAGLTHRKKYDLSTEKGQEKLLMKSLTYTTPLASLGVLFESGKTILSNERGGGVTRTIPGLSVADQLSRVISQEPLSVKQFRSLLTLTPPAHLPILGEVIRDELYTKMNDRDEYEQWLLQSYFENKNK